MTLQYPCVSCTKPVKKNQRGLQCTYCLAWTHTHCAGVRNEQYDDVHYEFLNWRCSKCIFDYLPFNRSSFNEFSYVKTQNLERPVEQTNSGNNTSEPTLHYDEFNNHDFKCAHLNIRSLYRNIDELRVFLHNNHIQILALNETLLDDSISDNELNIQDYNLIRKDRNRNGGGVAVYIRDSISYDLINSAVLDSLELILIRVRPKSATPFLFLSWYRPPDSKIAVMDQYENALAFVDSFRSNVFLMGDVNCDIRKKFKSNVIKRYEAVNKLYSMEQVNTIHYTRVTHNTKSLIDHMLTNAIDMVKSHGVISLGLSDHNLCYFILNFKSVQVSKTITYRNLKNMDLEAFRSHLSNHPWHEIEAANSVDEAVRLWETFLMQTVDELAPIRKKRVRNIPAPWLKADIKNLMKKRDELKRKASKFKDEYNMNLYRKARNLVTKKIRFSKKAYFSKQLFNASNNTSGENVWKVLKPLLPSKSKSSDKGVSTAANGSSLANEFNKFFANVGSKLASKIPAMNRDSRKYHSITSSFQFKPITENCVIKTILGMSNKKSTGVDNISMIMIKMAVPTIVPSLTHIFNRSLSERVFPSNWKRSKIIPIHKSGDKNSPNNYRPISILPSVSKILEKLVQVQLADYLKLYEILSPTQSGFRKSHSTISTLIKVTDDWLSAMDQGLYTGAVFIDLRKAFDTVDPHILLNKLSNIGVSANCLQWFTSYLTDRRISTLFDSSTSVESNIEYGVPQGSILGPLLFIIYIDDIVKQLNRCSVQLYADDTVIYFSHKDVSTIESVLNSELQSVFTWLCNSKLSLNCDKTVSMLFGSHKMLKRCNRLRLQVNGNAILHVESTKYLGMLLDPSLKWNLHIDKICTRISKLVRLLSRLRHTINSSNLKIVYNALILPIFDYGDVLYGTASSKYIDSLQKLQNRACRIILGVSPYSHMPVRELHARLGWKSLETRRCYHLNTMVFKALNELAPPYLKECFQFCERSYSLRSNGNLALPKPRTDYCKRKFSYRGSLQFNSLPPHLKNPCSLASFSHKLNLFLPDLL